MKIAICQTRIIWEDKQKNTETAERWIQTAAGQGTQLVLFPEMSFTGFSMHTEKTGESDDETIRRMQELSVRHHTAIGFGWVKTGDPLAENHYTVTGLEGEILFDYAKIHPFSYAHEDRYFTGGSALDDFILQDIPMSALICYDLRFPELFQVLAKKAHVIIVAANWPAARDAHWTALLRARAIETQSYVIGVNCCGDMGKASYKGNSCIIRPDGEVVRMVPDREEMICYDLNDDVESYRASFPVRQDRKEQLYLSLYQQAGISG